LWFFVSSITTSKFIHEPRSTTEVMGYGYVYLDTHPFDPSQTYIGFVEYQPHLRPTETVEVRRDKHRDVKEDGGKKKGAKHTAMWNGNVDTFCYLKGFDTTSTEALRFETAWQLSQAPKKNKWSRKRRKSYKKTCKHGSRRTIAQRFEDLLYLLKAPWWYT